MALERYASTFTSTQQLGARHHWLTACESGCREPCWASRTAVKHDFAATAGSQSVFRDHLGGWDDRQLFRSSGSGMQGTACTHASQQRDVQRRVLNPSREAIKPTAVDPRPNCFVTICKRSAGLRRIPSTCPGAARSPLARCSSGVTARSVRWLSVSRRRTRRIRSAPI